MKKKFIICLAITILSWVIGYYLLGMATKPLSQHGRYLWALPIGVLIVFGGIVLLALLYLMMYSLFEEIYLAIFPSRRSSWINEKERAKRGESFKYYIEEAKYREK